MRTVSRYKKRRNIPMKIISLLIILAIVAFAILFARKKYFDYRYPLKYEELVEKYSEENNLDHTFVYALIKNESGFDPDAVSHVPARGLMQITEETFDWLKFKMADPNDEHITYADMFDPEINIKYGTFFLSILIDELGTEKNALCGYHAGINAAKKWQANPEYAPNGEDIVIIPYENTEIYVNRVMKSKEVYKKLYFSEEEN